MVLFVEKLLQDMLEHERAQQALDPKLSGDKEDKPWSIIIKFHYYKVNEEILPKGQGKKRVFFNERPIYYHQDYPPAVLQKQKEYSEAK